MPKTHDHDRDSDSDIGSPSASVIFSDISMAPSNIKSDTSSRTSVDASMRSPSPTQSVMSVTSSVRAQSYRYEHGRGVNNYSEVYRLPADDVEIDRLGECQRSSAHHVFSQSLSDAQHQMVNKIMGKYAPPLPEVMADNVPGETKAVLDLGCGSGTWYGLWTQIAYSFLSWCAGSWMLHENSQTVARWRLIWFLCKICESAAYPDESKCFSCLTRSMPPNLR